MRCCNTVPNLYYNTTLAYRYTVDVKTEVYHLLVWAEASIEHV